MNAATAIAIGWCAIMSVPAFFAFALDKRAARRHAPRTPERTLHLLGVFGGWPGSIAAIMLCRHKSRKPAFLAVTVLIVAVHAAGWLLAGRWGLLGS